VELQEKQEELQAQQEELRLSNAELEQQAASLKASEELLQTQQEELQQTNAELEEKAALLAEQNSAIEIKNSEIENARRALEERAEQLALSSKYKSEFLANMSHELRTPLNSLLILARLLAENPENNLSPKQVEFAKTIHNAGSDLLQLINDILDLSKVEAGKMDVHPEDVPPGRLVEYVDATFRPLTVEKNLGFDVGVAPDAPVSVHTDEHRLQQILRNLLSNAVKFTEAGEVRLLIHPAGRRAVVSRRWPRPTAGRVLRSSTRASSWRRTSCGSSSRPSSRPTARPAASTADRPRAVHQPRDRAAARRRDPRREVSSGGGCIVTLLTSPYGRRGAPPFGLPESAHTWCRRTCGCPRRRPAWTSHRDGRESPTTTSAPTTERPVRNSRPAHLRARQRSRSGPPVHRRCSTRVDSTTTAPTSNPATGCCS
jgi:hypothetical protein